MATNDFRQTLEKLRLIRQAAGFPSVDREVEGKERLMDTEKEEFKQELEKLSPDSECAAEIWIGWAGELEDMDRTNYHSSGRLSPRDYVTQSQFLGEFIRLFQEVREKHGPDAMQQVISLAEVCACPYPWEINLAAQRLAEGAKAADISGMILSGHLDDVTYRLPTPLGRVDSEPDLDEPDLEL